MNNWKFPACIVANLSVDELAELAGIERKADEFDFYSGCPAQFKLFGEWALNEDGDVFASSSAAV